MYHYQNQKERSTTMQKIKTDIYIRLSSKSQEDGMSRDTQEKECRKYCKKHGIIVRNVYYENKSALYGSNRPIFKEILECQKKKIELMLLWFIL